MFWDGQRWIPDAPAPGRRSPSPIKPRRLRDWLATIPLVLLVPALLAPMLPAQAGRAVPSNETPAIRVRGSVAPGGSVKLMGTGFTPVARAAITWDVPVDQVEWSNGAAICLSGDQKGEKLSLADLAYRFGRTGGPVANQASVNLHGIGPGFAVHLCDVEVDPETGGVTVLRYTAAQDVGRAIHASYVEGQMQGGAAQGIGWALNEEYIFDTDGKMENPGFLDYRMPVASDLPMIDTIMIEVPCRNTPFGAKGVGEVPIVPPLAAVANAVRGAIGKRPHSLPLSPPRIHALIANGHS